MFRTVFDDGRFGRVEAVGRAFVNHGTAYAISGESSGPGATAATRETKKRTARVAAARRATR
jgi:hypothetical protein